MRTAIVGGGAAGFFLAVNLKEMRPEMDVTIFERGSRLLSKVEISGGGRCNCTNTFEDISDLSAVYPRGHRLMKRLMNVFSQDDAYGWFERHGVPLTVQSDHCVFPQSQDSHTIIDCLMGHARRYGVRIVTGHPVSQLSDLEGFDFKVIATGGMPRNGAMDWLGDAGHDIVAPVPSLFSLGIGDQRLKALSGVVTERGVTQLPGTKIRTSGPLLITHWGLSGPAILRLSSHAARILHDSQYHAEVLVNWTGLPESEVREGVVEMSIVHRLKQVASIAPLGLPHRLWDYLLGKYLPEKSMARWGDLGRKDLNRLVGGITCDTVTVTGRAPFRDEFVTCGGISLKSVSPTTLESRSCPRLFFAGEVLDIDGVTGGFNFQAAWTTAYTVAQAIAAG